MSSFGLAKVVQLKSNTEDIPIEKRDAEHSEVHSTKWDEMELRKRAEMIAKGRKAKKLKRQADHGATAAALKVLDSFFNCGCTKLN